MKTSRSLILSALFVFMIIGTSCANENTRKEDTTQNTKTDTITIYLNRSDISDSDSKELIKLNSDLSDSLTNVYNNFKGRIEKCTFEETCKIFGTPQKDETFVIKDALIHEFRVPLLNKYKSDSTTEIREVTWFVDHNINMTIWYEVDEKNAVFEVYFWNKYSQF